MDFPKPQRGQHLVKITVYVTPEEHQQLKVEAAKRGITLTALFMEAVYSRGNVIHSSGQETK